MVFLRLTYLLRYWEIFICFWSQYLKRFGLTTIKSTAFLFLLEQRMSGAVRGVGISKVSYMTSITVSSGVPQSASSVRHFLSWLRLWTFYNIYHVPNSFFNRSHLPKRFVVFEDSEKYFISGIISFWGYDARSSNLRLLQEYFVVNGPYPTSAYHLGWRLWGSCFVIWCHPVYLNK